MNWRTVGLAAVWAAFLVMAGSALAPAADKAAPHFALPNLEGKQVALAERLKEGPVIVDFWATWCKPCIKAFPDLQEIFDNYKDCGLSVFAISIDGPRSTSRVGALIKSKGNTFEVLLDPVIQGRPLAVRFEGEGDVARFHVVVWKLGSGEIKPRAVTSGPDVVSQVADGAHVYVIPRWDTSAFGRLAIIITRLDGDESADPVGAYRVTLESIRDEREEVVSE